MNVQFKKGVLELCVLAVAERGDCYGYELVERISQSIDIAEGTIYPLLRRLHEDGCFETYLKESGGGAPRKYYRLTPQGREVLRTMRAEWTRFVAGVSTILSEGTHHDPNGLPGRAGAAAEQAP